MSAAEFAENVEVKCVSPGKERRFHFQDAFSPVTEEDVVGCLIFKPIRAPQFAPLGVRPEKKMRHIEHVRAQIGEDAEAFVAPGRVADIAGSSITVKKPGKVDFAQISGTEDFLEPGNVWLKPV